MKRILIAAAGLVMMAGVAQATLQVFSSPNNVTAGTPATRTMGTSMDTYYLSVWMGTGTGTPSYVTTVTTTDGVTVYDQANSGTFLASGSALNTTAGSIGYTLFKMTNSVATDINLTYDWGSAAGNMTVGTYRFKSIGGNEIAFSYNGTIADLTTTTLNHTWNYDWSAYENAQTNLIETLVVEAWGANNATENPSSSNPLMLAGPSQPASRISRYAVLTNQTTFADTWLGAAGGSSGELASFSIVEYAVIPEPATIGMLCMGGLIMMGVRRFSNRYRA